MKVLLIDVYNYNKGGAETVCFNTGDLLKAHGHEVIYFTLKWEENNPSPYSKYFPESKETRKGPLKQVKNMVNYFYHFEAAQKMEQLLKQEKPDIAHIHLMWGQITPSIFPVLKRHNIPIVFTVHDYRIVCPAYTFRDGSGRICEDCAGKHFYKCFTHTCTKDSKVMSAVMAAEQYFRNAFFHPLKYIDGFMYVSNFAREIHEKYMPTIKHKKHITLYNFSTSIASKPKLMPTEKYYLFFGRLSYEKGIQTLFDAFSDLPTLKLKVVGTGPLEKDLKKMKSDKHLENIEFLGYKRGKELVDLVSGAYAVIVPSEWYENNPMTIIESYSVATPVIGARIGGIPEIIRDGQSGYIFESGNAENLKSKVLVMDTLNEAQYSTLSQGAIDFAHENLSVDSYWKKLIDFYQEFVRK